MLLSQIIQPTCIKVPMNSNDKQSAIIELIDLLDSNNLLSDKAAAVDAVTAREQTRSTGIGSGIAIPHGKCNAVQQLIMAIGIAKKPIEFDSVDDKPVSIIIMLISPLNETGPHIQALASISRLMLNEQFKQSIEQASSAEELYRLLQKKEAS
jgi:fructose-specific phosphotransferase system IIA component